MAEHGPNFPEPPPKLVNGVKEYEVEAILGQWVYGQWKKKQYLIKWKGYSDVHNSWESEGGVNAPELVKEYLASHPAHICSLANKRGTKLYDKNMPNQLLHHLSSVKYFYGFHPSDAIEAKSQWAKDPEQIPAAAYDTSLQHFGLHLYTVEADLPRDISLEGTGEFSMAPLPSTEELFGAMPTGEQHPPSWHSSHTAHTLDTSYFVDHTMGDCHSDQLQTDTALSSLDAQEDVDWGESGVEEDTGVEHSPTSSLYLYNYVLFYFVYQLCLQHDI